MRSEGGGQIRGLVVAIDGPAGVGKSTLARALARELRLPYVNTGLMYRALAGRSREAGVDPGDEIRLVELARTMTFSLDAGDPLELSIDGRAPAASLSSPEVEAVVSAVARHPSVRALMRAAQRELGLGGSVMEGRDIGTVVFPDADLKFYLDASDEERGLRRYRQLRGRGEPAVLAEIVAEIEERDRRDRSRAHSPLRCAPDAERVDTTLLSMEEVVALLLERCRQRLRRPQKP